MKTRVFAILVVALVVLAFVVMPAVAGAGENCPAPMRAGVDVHPGYTCPKIPKLPPLPRPPLPPGWPWR